MKIAVLISIMLHIAILSSYPALNLGGRRGHHEKVNISFLRIPGESFSVIGDKLSAGTSEKLNLLKNSKVWEVLWPEIDIDVLKEPEDINSFLKNGDNELLGIEIYEKETPLLTEEMETADAK